MLKTSKQAFIKWTCYRKLSNFSKSGVEFRQLTGADKHIALYGLNRPADSNSLGSDMLAAMKEVNAMLKEDNDISVVVLHSLVPGTFCAGVNLKELQEMKDDDVASFTRTLRDTFTALEDLPMPTIAAIDGSALGGGLELALACDMSVVSHSERLGLLQTAQGLIPGGGGTQRLPRIIHINIAKELIFASREISGKYSREIGLVNYTVEQNSTRNAAFELALNLARDISANAPIALRCAKKAINEGMQLSLKQGCELEQECYEVNLRTQDRREGIMSFLQKQQPKYQGM